VSRPPDTRSARRVLPAGRRTRTSLPHNSDAGLASALPHLVIRCLRAASSSWTPLCPLSATGLPGTALSCSYLASLRARLPGAPAPLGASLIPMWSRSTGLLSRLLDGAQQLLRGILGLSEPMPRQVNWLTLQQLLRGILSLSEPMPRQVNWLTLQQLLRGILSLSEPMPRQVSWLSCPGL
jgi:hypothetical protein